MRERERVSLKKTQFNVSGPVEFVLRKADLSVPVYMYALPV
jgi:hypothetical protein